MRFDIQAPPPGAVFQVERIRSLKLTGRRVLVGGGIGRRGEACWLLADGALVTVVAPGFDRNFISLSDDQAATVRARGSDMSGMSVAAPPEIKDVLEAAGIGMCL
jgi:hypothetical protein